MRLKTAAKIDRVVTFILSLICLPFAIIVLVAKGIIYAIEYTIINPLVSINRKIGNKLLLNSNEVKDKTIANPDALKYRASEVYQLFIKEVKL